MGSGVNVGGGTTVGTTAGGVADGKPPKAPAGTVSGRSKIQTTSTPCLTIRPHSLDSCQAKHSRQREPQQQPQVAVGAG